MMRYPAKIRNEEDGYCVYFLGTGMDGCVTYGTDLADAKKNAQEALDCYLESFYQHREPIPLPETFVQEDDLYYFEPSPKTDFAITLRFEREKRSLSQQEIASKMGIACAQYQRMENPRKANPTLETIIKIQEALGAKIFLKI